MEDYETATEVILLSIAKDMGLPVELLGPIESGTIKLGSNINKPTIEYHADNGDVYSIEMGVE